MSDGVEAGRSPTVGVLGVAAGARACARAFAPTARYGPHIPFRTDVHLFTAIFGVRT